MEFYFLVRILDVYLKFTIQLGLSVYPRLLICWFGGGFQNQACAACISNVENFELVCVNFENFVRVPAY